MAIGVSAESDPFTDMLVRGAQQAAIRNSDYCFAIRFWETKENKQVPQANNPSLQEELNKTHAVYQQRNSELKIALLTSKTYLPLEKI